MTRAVGNGTVRMGKRLSLRQQLQIRKLPNTLENQKIFEEVRGRPLALRVVTPGEHIIRAALIIGKSLAEIEKAMERVDALHRAPETTPVVDLLELPSDQIITIKAGAYSGLGGRDVPDHAVELAEDRSLFPLTLGFLERFSSVGLVRNILSKSYNNGHAGDKLVRGINIDLALSLLRIINPNLLGGVRLKLPAEAVLSVFFGQEEFMNAPGRNALLLTATPYRGHGLVNLETTDIEARKIDKDDKFVYRYGSFDPGDQTYKIGRHYNLPDSPLLCSVLLEVVAA